MPSRVSAANMPKMEIDQIIDLAGGTTKLGECAGVDRTTVNWWKRVGRIPVDRALRISDRLGIPLHEIRPDVWKAPVAEDAAG